MPEWSQWSLRVFSGIILEQRIRKIWKLLSIVAGMWIWMLFPIPFLPLFNAPYDLTFIRVTLIIVGIASIPFTLLALFMNSGSITRDEP
jgi:hypothetical protein